jgi:cytochrome c1
MNVHFPTKRAARLAALAIVALAGLSILPASAAQDKKRDPAQFARGAKAWADTCSRCHNLRNVKDQTDSEWGLSVAHMRVRGNIPGQVARDIEAFLRASN